MMTMTLNSADDCKDALRYATALRRLWSERGIDDPVLRELEQALSDAVMKAIEAQQ